MKKVSETILLYRIANEQDPEAFGELYDIYIKQIYRFVYFKVNSREEAEDITADVFLKAWNYLQEHREITSFSGLLYRMARNAVVDLYRQRSAHAGAVTDEMAETLPDTGSWQHQVETKIEHQKIIQSLKKLKEEYREVITLRFIDGLEIVEIAEITNKGQIAVRVMLHRAIKRLQQILNHDQHDQNG